MLANLVEATIDLARVDVAVDAVREELVPEFLEHEGALHGYWAVDRRTGHAVVLTTWRDVESLRGAAAANAAARARAGDGFGLRMHSVQTLPVLAASHATDLTDHGTEPAWVRVTRVDGLAPTMRDQVPQRYGPTLADQSATAGFCASYWLGDEQRVEGFAVSLWDDKADPASGEAASRRRRKRLQRSMGIRISSVREYRIVGVARPTPTPVSAGAEAVTV